MVKKKTLGSKILDAAILILTALTHWVVFYFIIITACKSKTESARFSLALPKEWALLENLKFVFTYNHGAVFQAFYNSLILTACSIFVLVIVAAMAAFVLQRRRNRFCQASNKLILAGLIVPASVIPTYWMLSILGVANTLPGLILVEVATLFPFATMMYKGFIATLPREIDEAALLDGCGSLRLFFRIIFPRLSSFCVPSSSTTISKTRSILCPAQRARPSSCLHTASNPPLQPITVICLQPFLSLRSQ